jgi:hypothetical protein
MRSPSLAPARPWDSPRSTDLSFYLVLPALAIALAGCSAVTTSTPLASGGSAAITGRVHGGQQPVVGATVQLIAPGTSGYGSAGSVLATTTTGANGTFTLPQPYTCPANSGLLYLLATGGNAGAGTNSAIAEAAIVGNCSSLTASTFFAITEVTTVAAASALAPFATIANGSTAIGTSATNLQGLYNAAGAYNNLVNNSTGYAHVTADLIGIIPPTAELNTLADILASCVNQGTTTALTGTCSTLFTASTSSGGTVPSDTFQAAVIIAQQPGRHVSALFGLVPSGPPFQPTLSTQPNDFSLALGFNDGAIGFGGTIGVAIDAAGDAWFTTGVPGTGNSATHVLTEISPSGTYISGSTPTATTGLSSALLSTPVGIAIDQNGYLLIANNGGGNLLKLNTDGTLKSTFTATSFSGPNGVAIDAGGNPWVANFGSALVTKILGSTGVEASNSPFTAGFGGVDIAAGPKAIWQTNYQSHYLYRIDTISFAVTSVQIGGSIGDVAIDHANNAWVAVTGNGSIFEISDSGGYVNTPNGGYQVAGTSPQNIAVDGLGNVFAGTLVSSGTSMGTLLEYSNSATLISPGLGFTGSNVIPVVPEVPGGIAIDGSGNVWVAGSNSVNTAMPNLVAEVIGIAAPVVTPRSVATTNNTLGVRP